jgi:hypothetical protein
MASGICTNIAIFGQLTKQNVPQTEHKMLIIGKVVLFIRQRQGRIGFFF